LEEQAKSIIQSAADERDIVNEEFISVERKFKKEDAEITIRLNSLSDLVHDI